MTRTERSEDLYTADGDGDDDDGGAPLSLSLSPSLLSRFRDWGSGLVARASVTF